MYKEPKIKIDDNIILRKKLYNLYDKASQKEIFLWSMEIATKVFETLGLDKNIIFKEAKDLKDLYLKDKVEIKEIRKLGSKIHRTAREQKSEINKIAFRVLGQAVGTGHMKEHGIISSDYSIKLINLGAPNDIAKVEAMRKWQISKLEKIRKGDYYG